jgi:hypothetical protein
MEMVKMAETKCTGCEAPATTTVDQWRGPWEIAVLPACTPCAESGALN